jgi:Fis family transcriptional regulator
MLEVVMHQAGGNQTVAANLLGINRNTLRRKLAEHQLL